MLLSIAVTATILVVPLCRRYVSWKTIAAATAAADIVYKRTRKEKKDKEEKKKKKQGK